MNFRNGFNFFKNASRVFATPQKPCFSYSKNLQKVVNKALINESSRSYQLAGINHFLTLQNLAELLKGCEEKGMVDEIVSSMQGIISADKVITCLRSDITHLWRIAASQVRQNPTETQAGH